MQASWWKKCLFCFSLLLVLALQLLFNNPEEGAILGFSVTLKKYAWIKNLHYFPGKRKPNVMRFLFFFRWHHVEFVVWLVAGYSKGNIFFSWILVRCKSFLCSLLKTSGCWPLILPSTAARCLLICEEDHLKQITGSIPAYPWDHWWDCPRKFLSAWRNKAFS